MNLSTMSARQRSEHMARIRGRDTKPEMQICAFLHEAGIAFESFVESLPGTPDIVVASRRVAVFIHGCFWHGSGCRRSKPKVNRDFWEQKFAESIARDRAAAETLRADGWRVFTVWECEARAGRSCRSRLLRALAPDRRLCHNCSCVAAPDYSMCTRCYRLARKVGPVPPRTNRGRDKDTRRRRRRLGLCTTCGMPAGDKYAMCPAHAERARARSVIRPASGSTYKRLAAQGLCRCHEPVKPGSTRCERCLKKLRREAKKRYQRYKEQKRCRRCPLPALPNAGWCADHLAKTRASVKRATVAFIKRRRDAKLCVTCAEPSETYNCPKCRKKITDRAKKKRST